MAQGQYFGPVPLWWWSGERLDTDRLCWQVDRFLDGGVREAVVISLAPSGPNAGARGDDPHFFSEPWWEIFLAVCEHAHSRGFGLWFYDQIGFSGAHFQAHVVAADPSAAGWRIDHVDNDFVVARDGFDYLSPHASGQLIDMVHGEFERRAGDWFGSVIRGSFQDELASMPTWSETFPDEFASRRGYRLEPLLAAAWGGDDTTARQVRRDYQLTRAELAEEAFFRPLYEWHHERNLLQGCDQQEPARNGHVAGGIRYYADYMRTHRWLSAPGSDHWGDGKIHSSLAHVYERPRVWIESFHGTGWGGTIEETFDWLVPWLRAGANLYNPHAAYYSTAEGRFEWSPPSTCWRQPYWAHYRQFADTVARLCGLVATGTHICDVAVLHPTATVQQDLSLTTSDVQVLADSSVLPDTPPQWPEAHQVYVELVGIMKWFDYRPGLLDRERVDFDVIDEPSIARAVVVNSALEVSGETYSTVVLPATRALEPTTAERLCEFVTAGGTLVAVGTLPADTAGHLQDDAAVEELRHLFDSGRALTLAAGDLAGWLACQPRRVRADVPTLLRRRDDGSHVLLVPAAFPMSTQVPQGWARAEPPLGYDFEPSRWASRRDVTVTGTFHSAELMDLVTGQCHPLAVRSRGDALDISVPFDGPVAVVILRETSGTAVTYPAHDTEPVEFGRWTGPWTATPQATIDNHWGDFPQVSGNDPVQVWRMEHDRGDGCWRNTRATYGTWAVRTDPRPRAELPPPSSPREAATLVATGLDVGDGWEPVEWSFRWGVFDVTGGFRLAGANRGHIPEGFLALGRLLSGEGLVVRTILDVAVGGRHVLEVGAPARVTAWIDGRQVGGPSIGYHLTCPVEVTQGRHLVELRFEGVTTEPVVASFTLRAGESEPWPQWLSPVSNEVRHQFTLTGAPAGLPMLVATRGTAVVRINGLELARHGEYDNYRAKPRFRIVEYDAAHACQPGENAIEVTLGMESIVLIDALLPGGERLVTNVQTWDGATTTHSMVGWDPQPLTLAGAPRRHPLPDRSPDRQATPVPAGRRGVERLRIPLPPGAVRVRVPARSAFTVNDPTVTRLADHDLALSESATGGDVLILEFNDPGLWTGGALLAGPATVAVDAGAVSLGDWSANGLADFSGAVEYRALVDLEDVPPVAHLDLGRVRGTAEVRVNGHAAGVRLWSPYRFDASGKLRRGSNEVSVTVCNTIAPYLAAVNPAATVYPGQEVSGLFGPVGLLTPHA